MSSRLFWFYIVHSSKPYGSDYYSLSRNYIKNFGIFDFSSDQIEHLIELESQAEIDDYLEGLYGININEIHNIEQLILNEDLVDLSFPS